MQDIVSFIKEMSYNRNGEKMQKYQEIERNLITKNRKTIWARFIKAVKDYELIKENDKIAVCISGGKDSMLMAKCIQELQKHGDVSFEAVYLVMDPGYKKENRELIIKNAEILNIPIVILNSDIFGCVEKIDQSPCYLCARMRRGFLYSNAQKLGCNKIALGHHFDDVIETVLMSMFYASEIKTMPPKLKSDNFENMELIRPLYHVREKDIIAWKKSNELEFLQCACKLTEGLKNDVIKSKRQETKELIKRLKEINPDIDKNIFRSIHNVNLDTIVGYRKGQKYYDFNEIYKENKNK